MSPKDMALSPREKQRERDSFAEATESREIFRELGKFVNPSDTGGFTAQKSQSPDWLKFIW